MQLIPFNFKKSSQPNLYILKDPRDCIQLSALEFFGLLNQHHHIKDYSTITLCVYTKN